MKIIGLLNWYDESPSWLATAVAGFARVCDTIIAVDGSYMLYNGRPCSHPNQAEAIQQAAEAAGAGCIIYRPKEVWWDNELGKRNQLLRLAGALDLTRDDWLIVFDADCHPFMVNPEMVRSLLANTDLDVGTYTALDGKDFLSDAKLHEYVVRGRLDHEWTLKTRDVFRWNPTLRVGPQHWLYSVLGDDGERKWVRGPEALEGGACDLGRNLVIYHRTADRSLVRQEAQKFYYKMREQHGVEFLENMEPPVYPDDCPTRLDEKIAESMTR